MKDSKEGYEYEMKRNSPEWKNEMEKKQVRIGFTQKGEKKTWHRKKLRRQWKNICNRGNPDTR